MHESKATPPFPSPVTFPDVEATILAQEDTAIRTSHTLISGGAWHSYMRRVLPPMPRKAETLLYQVGSS
jgi:hypothetical protein